MITTQQKEQLKILMESGCYYEDEAEDELYYLFNMLTEYQLKQLCEDKGLSVVEWVEFDDEKPPENELVMVNNQGTYLKYTNGCIGVQTAEAINDFKLICWAYIPQRKESKS